MAVNTTGGVIISQLDPASALNNNDIVPVVQEYVSLGGSVKETKKTTLNAIKEFFLGAIPAWAKAPQKPSYTAEEVGATTPAKVTNAADNAELNAKAYTNTRLTDYLTETETNLLLQERIRSLLVDKGPVSDRGELPETADNFDSYMIEDEELIVFAYNSISGVTWLPLGFFVDMGLYETVSGATEKMEAAELAANAYTDTKVAYEAQLRNNAIELIEHELELLSPVGFSNAFNELVAKAEKTFNVLIDQPGVKTISFISLGLENGENYSFKVQLNDNAPYVRNIGVMADSEKENVLIYAYSDIDPYSAPVLGALSTEEEPIKAGEKKVGEFLVGEMIPGELGSIKLFLFVRKED